MAVVVVAEGIWFVTRALGYVLFPHTAAGSEDNSRLVASLAGFFFYASIVAAVLLGLVSRQLVPYLFGQKFLAAVPTLLALLPGVAAFSVVHVLAGYLIGRGKAMWNTYVALLSLVLTVALDLILIPRLGISGAGVASSVAYVASAGLTLWFFSRLSNVKLRTVFTPGSSQFGPMVSYARTKVQGLAGH
jgi:O-antigen/teichoic acid export membrane protein